MFRISAPAVQCCRPADVELIINLLPDDTCASSILRQPGEVLLWTTPTHPSLLYLSFMLRGAVTTTELPIHLPSRTKPAEGYAVELDQLLVSNSQFQWLVELQESFVPRLESLSHDLSYDLNFSSVQLSSQAVELALRSRQYVLTATSDHVKLYSKVGCVDLIIDYQRLVFCSADASSVVHGPLHRFIQHTICEHCKGSSNSDLAISSAPWPEAALPFATWTLAPPDAEMVHRGWMAADSLVGAIA